MKLEDLDERCVVQLIQYFIKNRFETFIVSYLESFLKEKEFQLRDKPDGFQFLYLILFFYFFFFLFINISFEFLLRNIIFNLPTNEAFTVHSLLALDIDDVIVCSSILLFILLFFSYSFLFLAYS